MSTSDRAQLSMAVLNSYFDASGSGSDRTGVLTVGGYIGDVSAWRRFEQRWEAYLQGVGITGPFRMTAFINGQDEFVGWEGKPAAQMKVLCDLAAIINRSVRACVATSVRIDDWRAADKVYRMTECRFTPYAIAAYAVTSKSIRWIGRRGRGHYYNRFVFESGDNGQADFEWVMRQVIERGGPALEGMYPVFQPKALKPLQACDFAAWENGGPCSPNRRRQPTSESHSQSWGGLA